MTDPSLLESGPVDFFTADHRVCDDLWTAVEGAVDEGNAPAARDAFQAFDQATRRHFDLEEQILFPALEEAAGMPLGPTRMMKVEHEQMRGLLSQMAIASVSDPEGLVSLGDTLLMVTQQHNAKEEGILYPMAARQLQADWAAVATRLRQLLAACA